METILEGKVCEQCGRNHGVKKYEFIYTFRGKQIIGILCENCRSEQTQKENKLTRKTNP